MVAALGEDRTQDALGERMVALPKGVYCRSEGSDLRVSDVRSPGKRTMPGTYSISEGCCQFAVSSWPSEKFSPSDILAQCDVCRLGTWPYVGSNPYFSSSRNSQRRVSGRSARPYLSE